MNFYAVSIDEAHHAHMEGLLAEEEQAIEAEQMAIMGGGRLGGGGPVDLDWQTAIAGDIDALCTLLEKASKGYQSDRSASYRVVGKAIMDWMEEAAFLMAEKEIEVKRQEALDLQCEGFAL